MWAPGCGFKKKFRKKNEERILIFFLRQEEEERRISPPKAEYLGMKLFAFFSALIAYLVAPTNATNCASRKGDAGYEFMDSCAAGSICIGSICAPEDVQTERSPPPCAEANVYTDDQCTCSKEGVGNSQLCNTKSQLCNMADGVCGKQTNQRKKQK